MSPADKYLEKKIAERVSAGNLRTLTGERLQTDFFSNDYLGFATNGVVAQQMKLYPGYGHETGATGSRLLSGNFAEAELLEQAAAAFHDAEAALLFNSGYNANIGLIAAVAGREATIIYDALSHASILDGVRLSHAGTKFKFRHNDLEDLEQLLKKSATGAPLYVVIESVYSMDGDFAPLKDIILLTERYGASLIVDEAHATGVFGNHGEGLVHALGLQKQVFARVHTFGKAMGCHGAVVAGSRRLVQYLINFARSFIYTTALSGHSVCAARAAYDCMKAPDFSNQQLHDLIGYFRSRVATSQQMWLDSQSSIQAIIIPDNRQCRELSGLLAESGIQARAILSPTVPHGKERIRICLHQFNTTVQVGMLFDVLG